MGRRSVKPNPAQIVLVSSSSPDIPKEETYIWREALAAVDRVHGDGRLPSARLQWDEDLLEIAHFCYDPTTEILIRLNPRNIVHDLKEAFLHEIGHFLDAFALSPPDQGWASRHSPDLEQWRQAVNSTEAYASLRTLIDEPSAVELNANAVKLVNLRTVEYYLHPQELFARTYAQWIISRADDAQLTEWYSDYRGAAVIPVPMDGGRFQACRCGSGNAFSRERLDQVTPSERKKWRREMSSEELRQYFTQNPDRNLHDADVPEYFDTGRQPTGDKIAPKVAAIDKAGSADAHDKTDF